MPMTVIPSTPGLPLLAFTRRNAAFRFSRSHTSSINRFVLAGFSVPFVAPDGSVPSLPASRASPVSAEEKSSSIWIFCCLSSLRLMAYWPLLLVRAFSHRFRLGLSIAPPFGIRSASLGLRPPEKVFLNHFHLERFWGILSHAGLSSPPCPSAQTAP